MSKHDRVQPYGAHKPLPHEGHRLGTFVLIGAEQVRIVQARDIVAGDVLPTGMVLRVDLNDIDGEVRLEMVGANIHYLDYDETATVLARASEAVLDGVSVGTFVARKERTL